MIRDLRSLALSIMRQIEQIALKERTGEIQAEVPTEIAAFLLNEKRESLVYLEQDSGARITILPHAHLESPNFSLHFNPDGFAPSSYERIADAEEKDTIDKGYDTNWHTKADEPVQGGNRWQKASSSSETKGKPQAKPEAKAEQTPAHTPTAVAWLSNLFAPKPQAHLAGSLNNADVAAAIESIVNDGATSLGALGNITLPTSEPQPAKTQPAKEERPQRSERDEERKPRAKRPPVKRDPKEETSTPTRTTKKEEKSDYPKREAGSQRPPRGEVVRGETLKPKTTVKADSKPEPKTDKPEIKEPADKKEAPKARPQKATAIKHDDVVLHVSPVAAASTPAQTVHMSLDDSKPQKQTAPDATVTNKQPAQIDMPTKAVQENVKDNVSTPSEPKAEPTQHANEPAVADVVQAKPETAQPKPIEPAPAIDPVLHSTLIALAQQTGRAVNDPRVVRQAHKQPKASLSGSAGAYIRAVLGERATGQFISDFLTALAQNDAPAVDFDFANYGFAPLGVDYVTQFSQKVTPIGQFATTQGKTAVSPSPIGQRASNDPRGQHPDFVASLANPQGSPETTETIITEVTTANTDETLAVATVEAVEAIETHEAENQAVEITDTAEIVEPVEPIATTETESPAETMLPVETVLPAENESLTEMVQPPSTQTADETTTPETEASKDDERKKSNSYKDMIESVSGQLLQPMGILNLVATPKKPKPKPKTASKSPARKTSKAAQKAQVVKRKPSETDETPDTPKDTDDSQ